MEKANEVKGLVQSAYNEVYNAEKFCESYCVKAQKIGLQGSKRKLRYESVGWHQLKLFLLTDFYDFYGDELNMEHKEQQISTVTGVQDFYRKLLNYYEKLYNTLHSLSNSLVISNASAYSKHLNEKCACIMESIKHYRRTIIEGDNCGWNLVWLYQHETTDYNTHDTYEAKEKEKGYPT